MDLQDVVRIFHEPDCPGMILSSSDGKLACSECGEAVGQVQPAVLAELIDMLAKVPV